MTEDFDFLKELFKFGKPTKEEMINKYILGYITKKQLDEFMEKYNGRH